MRVDLHLSFSLLRLRQVLPHLNTDKPPFLFLLREAVGRSIFVEGFDWATDRFFLYLISLGSHSYVSQFQFEVDDRFLSWRVLWISNRLISFMVFFEIDCPHLLKMLILLFLTAVTAIPSFGYWIFAFEAIGPQFGPLVSDFNGISDFFLFLSESS